MVDDVVHSLTTAPDELLETNAVPAMGEGFFEHLQPHDDVLLDRLRELYRAHLHNQLQPNWLQEKLREVLGALVRSDRKLRSKIARLPLARPTTRLEIFRRVRVALDFLESNYPDSGLSLEVLAEQACLAPHHFLRSFKQVVGQTPHQYLLQLRLEKGRRLLTQGSFTVAQVAWLVGFESWEQFSRQFRRHFGTTPGAVRAAA
jgi:AraC-like DNA-binding protein